MPGTRPVTRASALRFRLTAAAVLLVLVRSGRDRYLAFAISEATVYNWIKQDRIDSGEIEGLTTNEAFLNRDLAPKACTR